MTQGVFIYLFFCVYLYSLNEANNIHTKDCCARKMPWYRQSTQQNDKCVLSIQSMLAIVVILKIVGIVLYSYDCTHNQQ